MTHHCTRDQPVPKNSAQLRHTIVLWHKCEEFFDFGRLSENELLMRKCHIFLHKNSFNFEHGCHSNLQKLFSPVEIVGN